MEELMEPKVITPVRVEVEFVVTSIAGTTPVVSTSKDVLEAVLELLSNVAKMHVIPRARGTFYFEGISVEHVKTQKRFNEKEVDTKPDGLRAKCQLYTRYLLRRRLLTPRQLLLPPNNALFESPGT